MTAWHDYCLYLIMIIAIANWQGMVSPVFDVSNKLCIIDVKNEKEQKRENVVLKEMNFFLRAKEMANMGIEVLICGAISHELETALISSGIKVIGFMCGEVESILKAFIRGSLSDSRFFMPGRFGKQHRHCFQFRRGRNFKRR